MSESEQSEPRSTPRFPARADLLQAGRGLLMGGADIIPGVSGGTVALILGIYQRLITAISHCDAHLFQLLFRREWSAAARYLDLRFIIPLGVGILTGVVSLASLMHYLLDYHLQLTLSLFFGLILASSFLVAQMVHRWTVLNVLAFIVSTIGVYILVGEHAIKPPEGNLYVFFCGMIAICAMILPGISGALILILLGKYHDVTGLLKTIPKELLKGNIDWNGLLTVLVFVLGCLVGLILFSKVLRWLLHNYHTLTMAVLCGLMVGSLRRIWPFKVDVTPYTSDQTPEMVSFKHRIYENVWPSSFGGMFWGSIALIIVAALLVWGLDRLSQKYAMHDSSEM
jgi:putative membrane protein